MMRMRVDRLRGYAEEARRLEAREQLLLIVATTAPHSPKINQTVDSLRREIDPRAGVRVVKLFNPDGSFADGHPSKDR